MASLLPGRGPHAVAALLLALLVFAADQAVKWAVTGPLHLQEVSVREVLPIFRLLYVENHGISMGFLKAGSPVGRWGLVVATGIIAILVTRWLWREKNRADALAEGAVLGGAAGNILDRVRLGYVVDYADLHFGGWSPFLVFNLADAAITIGVLLLVLRALLTPDRSGQTEARSDA